LVDRRFGTSDDPRQRIQILTDRYGDFGGWAGQITSEIKPSFTFFTNPLINEPIDFEGQTNLSDQLTIDF
jgi:hypothetical protein